MTPERWREITAAFHAVRASAPKERSAALDEACHGDASLRREVEALLAAGRDASGRGTTAVSVDDLPRLSPGTAFGAYRIDGVIGAGGMGQVYRATDTRLGRAVALKLVLPDLALDPDVTARFEREATLLAALNHPNIAAIYEVEAVDGVQALVLELVEGPSLAARCPLPMADALPIALQIASALEAAHARGIVHRDLKPGNIKIGAGHRVKVLDFGIAHAAGDARATMATQSAAPGTRPGLVIGTPAYMSPEQARGLPVDARTDIWAFGCVLFEMLTGRGPFAGDTASDSLARVIEREPDWSRLPADTPPAIARLLRRCLRKDPDERLHHIADARIEIAEATAILRETRPVRPQQFWRVASIVFGLGLIIAAAMWWRPWRAAPPPAAVAGPAMEFGVTFPNNFQPSVGIAISPDGRWIAANVWSNTGDIWVKALDDQTPPHPLPGGEGASTPFWSPDSSTLAFARSGQLMTLKPGGGTPTPTADLSGTWWGGTWNRSNVILYSDGGRLFRVNSSGGSTPAPVPLTGLPGNLMAPRFLPDGKHFLVCSGAQYPGTLGMSSLDGGAATPLGQMECPVAFAQPNYVLFVRGGSLLAQKVNLDRLTLEGEPAVVTTGVTRGNLGPWPVLTPTASDTGVLAIPSSRGGSVGHLVWYDSSGRALGSIEPPNDDAEYLNPAISPDGRLVAANLLDSRTGLWHIWVIDTTRGNAASPLTSDATSEFDPLWSPNGAEILYTSDRGGRLAFYRQSIAGGSPILVRDVTGEDSPRGDDWSADGHVFYQRLNRYIGSFPLADPSRTTRLADFASTGYAARISFDGKWLAYNVYAEDRHFDIFVERFPGGRPRRQISTGIGGVHARWITSSRGTELVYWAPPRGIKATSLTLTDQSIQIGDTRTLVDAPVLNLIDARPHYDITRDGRRLLVRQANGPQRPGIRVIVNWMARLPH